MIAMRMGLNREDGSYDVAVAACCAAVEINLPIICACVTTIRPLLDRLFPGMLGPRSSQHQVVASLANIPSLRMDSTHDPEAVARGTGWQDKRLSRREQGLEGGTDASTSGESLVIMHPEMQAYREDPYVEQPSRAYSGRVKPGMSFPVHPDRAV
ncbi:hypothetical protein IMZ48_02750 [Candidatus Bathyarchaeota archaeon]|nr:hypothetical protein [Candidatus Bathyarchaeota archaeon]